MLTEDLLVRLLARVEIEEVFGKEIKKISVDNSRIIGSTEPVTKVKVISLHRK